MKLKLEIEGETIYQIADQITKLASEILISRLKENRDEIERILSAKEPPIKIKTTEQSK